MKRPDMCIFQYKDGTFKLFMIPLVYSGGVTPACYIGIHGKIICKFKVYKK